MPDLSIKSHRQQALDRQWTQKWQSPHTRDATPQNLSKAVYKRRDSFWLSHSTLMLLVHIVPD